MRSRDLSKHVQMSKEIEQMSDKTDKIREKGAQMSKESDQMREKLNKSAKKAHK